MAKRNYAAILGEDDTGVNPQVEQQAAQSDVVPIRAESAEPREADAGRTVSLGDIPGDVDTQHVERNAFRSRAP